MPTYATTTANQLWSFTDYLQTHKVDVIYYLKKNNLPLSLLKYPHLKLATKLVYQFISDVASAENIPSPGWGVGRDIGWTALEEVTLKAANNQTLHDALKEVCELTSEGASHANFFIVESKDSLDFCHVGGVNTLTTGYFHVETYLVAVLIDFVRTMTGITDYQPDQIKLRSQINAHFSQIVSSNDSQLSGLQDYTAISIPLHLAALPCCAPQAKRTVKKRTTTLPDLSHLPTYQRFPKIATVAQIITPYLLDETPTIKFIADVGDISIRSLERKLEESETCYRNLIQYIRIDIAKCLLQAQCYTVTDVSALLQYQQTTHFIRAFKKLTGSTPKQFQLNVSTTLTPSAP